ncbi:MAG: hypothetical protein ACE5DZ_00780 [Mariprofundus sp.]
MEIKKAMNNYLAAIEKKFGAEARNNTRLEHRGGLNFFLKKADARHGQIVDLGNLTLMTRYIQTTA